MKKNSGFTLIEMLVTIAIIGILAAIVFPNFNDARDDSRNKAMLTKLKEMQLALEQYRAQEGRYPEIQAGSPSCTDNDNGNSFDAAWTADGVCRDYRTIENFIPEFISELPDWRDSGNDNCRIEYRVDSQGSWYKLTAERCFAGAAGAAEGIQPDTEFARCPNNCANCAGDTNNAAYQATTPFYETMAVYSPGGECQ